MRAQCLPIVGNNVIAVDKASAWRGKRLPQRRSKCPTAWRSRKRIHDWPEGPTVAAEALRGFDIFSSSASMLRYAQCGR